MKKEVLICDLCKKELHSNNWETGVLWDLFIVSNTSSSNEFAQKKLTKNFQHSEFKMELCWECSHLMADKLSQVILDEKERFK